MKVDINLTDLALHYVTHVHELLKDKKSISIDLITQLIILEHGLNIDEVNQILGYMSEPTFAAIYSYKIMNKEFVKTNSMLPDKGLILTANELSYAEQQFNSFKIQQENIGNKSITHKEFSNFFVRLFNKNVNIGIIGNYLEFIGLIKITNSDILF